MITDRFGAAFEKKGVARLSYLFAHSVGFFRMVLKSGKLAELSSFAIWELLQRMGVYNKEYLAFANEHPNVEFDTTGALIHRSQNAEILASREDNYEIQPLALDWAVSFTDGTGVLWGTAFRQRTALFRSSDQGTTAQVVYRFPGPISSIYVSKRRSIFVCTEGVIYKSEDGAYSFREVFEFATTNSRFRQEYTFTEGPEGDLFVGEYGLASDDQGNWQSVAWLYQSTDGGENWRKNDFFIREGANKHLHVVKYCANMQKIIVTDGDNHKRLWVNDTLTDFDCRSGKTGQPGWRLVNKRHIQMGGHTAIAEVNDELLFGTDYLGGTNFLLRTSDLNHFQRQVLPDPYRRSMIQQLCWVQAGEKRHLWCWISNMAVRGPNAKGLLMYSQNDGKSWTKFLEYDGVEHWLRIISSSAGDNDYVLITVDEQAYRISVPRGDS